jgi:hypothetical protein
LFILGQLTVRSTALGCGQSVPECIGIAWWSALSLLAGHGSALNTLLVVAHFGSDRRLRRNERHPSGIRFITGNLIRFQSSFDSSKVMAK